MAIVLMAGMALLAVGCVSGTDGSQGVVSTSGDDRQRDSASSGVLSEDEAAAFDYASTTGVDMAEAARRVRLLEEVGPTLDAIRKEARGILTGLYYEHSQDLLLHVGLTEAPGPVLVSILNESPLPVDLKVSDKLPRAVIQQRLDPVRDRIRKGIPGLQGYGTDEREGEVVFNVYLEGRPEEVIDARLEAEQFIASLSLEIDVPMRIEYDPAPLRLQPLDG